MKRFFLAAATMALLACNGTAQVPESVMNPDLNVDLPVWQPTTGVATVNIHALNWDAFRQSEGVNQLVINKEDGSQEIFDFTPDADGNITIKLSMNGVKNTWFHTVAGTIGGIWLKGGETVDAWLFPADPDKNPMTDFNPAVLTNGEYALYSYINAMPEYIQALDAEWTAGAEYMRNPVMDSEAYTNMLIAFRKGVREYLAAHPELPKAVRQYIVQGRNAFIERCIARPQYTCEVTLPPDFSLTFTELTPEQIARIEQ